MSLDAALVCAKGVQPLGACCCKFESRRPFTRTFQIGVCECEDDIGSTDICEGLLVRSSPSARWARLPFPENASHGAARTTPNGGRSGTRQLVARRICPDTQPTEIVTPSGIPEAACLLTNGTGSRTSKRRERLRPGAQQLVPATASQQSEKQGGTEAQRQR